MCSLFAHTHVGTRAHRHTHTHTHTQTHTHTHTLGCPLPGCLGSCHAPCRPALIIHRLVRSSDSGYSSDARPAAPSLRSAGMQKQGPNSVTLIIRLLWLRVECSLYLFSLFVCLFVSLLDGDIKS